MKTFILMMMVLSPVVAATEFSEIMYDPQGSDNNLEYIELLTTENLEGWTIADLSSNDTLELIQEGIGHVALIVEQEFNTTGLDCTIYSAGASIGNNLNNAGDQVFLYNNGLLIASTSYDDSKAKDNDLSLHWENEWIEGVKTPCIIDGEENIKNETYNDINNSQPQVNITLNETTTNHTNCTATKTNPTSNKTQTNNSSNTNNQSTQYNETSVNTTINQIEATTDSTVNQTEPITTESESNTNQDQTEQPTLNETDPQVPPNKTSDLTNATQSEPEKVSCTVQVQIQQEKQVYENKESIKFKNNVNGTNKFTVTYTITTLAGEVIRNTTTTNENQKTFTPNINKEIEVFILKSQLRSDCGEDFDEKIVIVRGDSSGTFQTNITIEKTDRKKYQSKEIIMVDFTIARFDTQKNAIKLWVEQDGEKVSEVTSLSVKNDGEFKFTVPVILKEKVGDGTALLKIEGVDVEKAIEIRLEQQEQEVHSYTITEEPITITNFRTNHKKPAKEINLYAKLTGNGVYIVRLRTLEGYEDELIGINGKLDYKKAITIKEGQHVFLLEIIQENKTLASASLLLDVTQDAIEEVAYFSEQIVEAQQKEEVKVESPIMQAITAPTQQAAYEEESASRFLPYVLGVIVVVIAGIVFMHKGKTNSTPKAYAKDSDQVPHD